MAEKNVQLKKKQSRPEKISGRSEEETLNGLPDSGERKLPSGAVRAQGAEPWLGRRYYIQLPISGDLTLKAPKAQGNYLREKSSPSGSSALIRVCARLCHVTGIKQLGPQKILEHKAFAAPLLWCRLFSFNSVFAYFFDLFP